MPTPIARYIRPSEYYEICSDTQIEHSICLSHTEACQLTRSNMQLGKSQISTLSYCPLISSSRKILSKQTYIFSTSFNKLPTRRDSCPASRKWLLLSFNELMSQNISKIFPCPTSPVSTRSPQDFILVQLYECQQADAINC